MQSFNNFKIHKIIINFNYIFFSLFFYGKTKHMRKLKAHLTVFLFFIFFKIENKKHIYFLNLFKRRVFGKMF